LKSPIQVTLVELTDLILRFLITVASPPLSRLSNNVPIVDPETGNPTPLFQRLIQQLLEEKTATEGEVATAVQNTRQIISGGGLTGGGDLSVDRTLVVGAGTGITVNADDVAIDTSAEAERIRDVIGTALVAGSNTTITVNDAGDTITIGETSGSSGGGYFRHRLHSSPSGSETFNVNSTSYVSFSPFRFYHDWDAFAATHFRIIIFGQANAAANTVTGQIVVNPANVPGATLSSGGNDVVASNGFNHYDSGWVAVNGTITGVKEYVLRLKGSNTTVDLAADYIDIHWKK
jgi:hypothetical protein